jgi:serine/threonine protein phosphatase 1
VSERILAIGDIHGCNTALEVLLGVVQPTSGDTVVVLGDVVDRGPDSRACIDRLLELRQSLQLVHLMGNHEEMMLDSAGDGGWLSSWLGFGGIETLQSYGRPPRFEDVPEEHWEFLRSARDSYASDREIFVHSNLEPNTPLDRQIPEWLRWQRLRGDERPDCSGKRVICGHTSLPNGVPGILDGWVDIDTWCYGGGWLTCLDVTTDTVWQANEAGESRGPVPLHEIAVDYRPWR